MSFIAIRDFKITANWSKEDKKAVEKSLGFGSFDLKNSTFEQNTVEINGLQILAWISKLTPPLPPAQAD
jgi:hypothetical protein